MPVFRSGLDQAPAWCEMQFFDIVELEPGQTHQYERIGTKEKLIVGNGACRIRFEGQEIAAQERANLDLTANTGQFTVDAVEGSTTLIRMCGDWEQELGGSGIFTGETSAEPQDKGDVINYEKTTNFDNHFHDCDEYWIVFQGNALVYTEGKPYRVGIGDCVATGMGHHHDMSQVYAPVRAIYFETTMAGQKRRGHLWDYTHGPAQAQKERI
jgi:mannose-6-phosphate isomerase-like protein (cupin superfamily)